MTTDTLTPPAPLPPAAVRAETWERLARQHAARLDGEDNDTTHAVIDRAIATLAPHLLPEWAWQAFTDLQDTLTRLDEAEDPMAVLDAAAIGPDFDPETYVIHCRRLVDDALRLLVGGAA